MSEQFSQNSESVNEALLSRARNNVMRPADDFRLAGNRYGEGSAILARSNGEDVGEDNSLRQFFALLGRRWALVVGTLILVLGLTAVYMILTPPVYEATATLQVHASEGSGGGGGGGDKESTLVMATDMGGMERSLGTQLTIIQSNQVRQGAFNRLSDDVRAKLRDFSNTAIEPKGDTTLIDITVTSHDRKASYLLANAYCDEYIQLSRAENRGRLTTALNYVTDQKRKAGQKLDTARGQLQRFKEQNKLVDVTIAASEVATTAAKVAADQEALKISQAETQAQLRRTAQMIPQLSKFQVLPGTTQLRPEVSAINSAISGLELKKLELLQKYRANRPEITILDDQMADLKSKLKTEAKTEIATWSNNLDPTRAGLESSLVTLQVQDWAMQARQSALAQAAAQVDAKMAQMPAKERQMNVLMLNLNALEKSYSALTSEQESLRMTQEARVANATKLFPAVPPSSPTSRLVRTLASAMLVGLLLALALAALVDWLDDGIYGEAEAKMITHLPVLAQIPSVTKEAQKSFASNADVYTGDRQISSMRENFRMLRTMIALSSTYPDAHQSGYQNGDGALVAANETPLGASAIRSIVITSSLPNEGKSVSCVNLAISAALSGEQVILVDCDLRHPNLHRFFDLPNDVGLANIVSGACTLEEALQSTRIPNLRVLSTGPIKIDPIQILNSPVARACFRELEEIADFVVIDTPPALVFAEAQIIAAMTDAMLLVISSQDAKKREVARTRDLLNQTGLVPLGVILNKITPGSSGAYSRYYDNYASLSQ